MSFIDGSPAPRNEANQQGCLSRSGVEVSCRADFDTNTRKAGSAPGIRHPARGFSESRVPAAGIREPEAEPMLYNSRHSTTGLREHSRPPTPRHRLLHSRLGNHGRRRLARHHGRLAAPRRRSRRPARLRDRRRAPASHRMGLRQTGHRHARRRRRNRLHLGRFLAPRQLRHRLDDDARLLHRLPVGSRRRRPHRRLHRSRPRFDGTLPHRRPPRVSSAPRRSDSL